MVLENEPEVLLIQETLRAQGVESTSNWLPLVVIVLVGFVIYGGEDPWWTSTVLSKDTYPSTPLGELTHAS